MTIRQNKTPWSDAEREVLRTTPSDREAARVLRQQHGQDRAPSTIRLERHRMELEALRADAARYRWLRAQHWSDSTLAVVRDPKHSVMFGHECPSLALLDDAIDRAMESAA